MERLQKAFKKTLKNELQYLPQNKKYNAQKSYAQMVEVVSGNSIYSQDFHSFMRRCGKGLLFEFCQDVFYLHEHYSASLCAEIERRYDFSGHINQEQSGNTMDPYRYDGILRKMLRSDTMWKHWSEFQRQIAKQGLRVGKHSRIDNVGILHVELMDIDDLETCNPFIQLGVGNQAQETPVSYDVTGVTYNGVHAFHIRDITKQKLWIKVMDFDEYDEKSYLMDSLSIGLGRWKQMDGEKVQKQYRSRKAGILNIAITFEATGKKFYYRDM